MADRGAERFRKQRALLRAEGGVIRMAEAMRLGLNRKTLYAMREAGVIDPLARGLYRLSDLPPLADPDLVTVAKRAPQGVVCLISALAFHELTTQVPHEVHLALAKGAEPPRIAHPPVHLYWFAPAAFEAGVEIHKRDGVSIRIYSPEKTLADCFKFRNKLGMDVVIEALRRWRETRHRHLKSLMTHARTCRVERVMRPYVEAVL